MFTACSFNQGNYFENATACSKRTLKTTVARQLIRLQPFHIQDNLKMFSNNLNVPTILGPLGRHRGAANADEDEGRRVHRGPDQLGSNA